MEICTIWQLLAEIIHHNTLLPANSDILRESCLQVEITSFSISLLEQGGIRVQQMWWVVLDGRVLQAWLT